MAKSKKKAEAEAAEEVVEAKEVEELPVKVSEPETVEEVAEITNWSAKMMTGAWMGKEFTYQRGAKSARIGGSPAAVQGISAEILNPQGDNAQIKLEVSPPSGSGTSIFALPRAEAVSLVAALSTAKAGAPTVSSRIGGAVSAVRNTIARRTSGCSSCGGGKR